MSTPSILYQTATQVTCLASGQSKLKFPLPSDCPIQFAAPQLDQDYEQRLDQFPPAPKNTPSNATPFSLNNSNAILTSLSQPQNSGAALGKYTASFNVVPATWNDVKSLPFTFPGFPGYIGQPGSRDIFTDKVDTRLQYDYYLIDPANIVSAVTAGTPGTATSVVDSGGTPVKCVYQITDIPLIAKSIFCVALSGTPDYSNRTNSLLPGTGATIGTTTWYQTQPQKSVYQTWISNAIANGWASTVWPGNNNTGGSYGQLVVEESAIQTYVGNIICRVTMFVLAK